jgi:hypothetical protein
LLLRAYAIDAGKDSDCRKQQTHSSDVYSVFGVPATAREAVGESLDAEFCQRGTGVLSQCHRGAYLI